MQNVQKCWSTHVFICAKRGSHFACEVHRALIVQLFLRRSHLLPSRVFRLHTTFSLNQSAVLLAVTRYHS